MVTNVRWLPCITSVFRCKCDVRVFCVSLWLLLTGCMPRAIDPINPPKSPPGEEVKVIYDTTAPKPVQPRDEYERWAQNRGADLRFIDKLMDRKTQVPELDRKPLPDLPPDTRIIANVAILDDTDPFPPVAPLAPKEATIVVGVARSTYRTREDEEVLSAIQPFIDLVQREVNIRGAPELHETAEEIYFALIDGKNQMVISHVFDYLLLRSWFASVEENSTVLLAWAQPAWPRTTDLDRDFPGKPGTSIELVVARDSSFRTPTDLKGTRLALAANYVHAPGAFLTRTLADLGHSPDQPFFSSMTLRRYPKDAVIDVVKGKADVACVDQGTLGALQKFYGIERHVRTLAVSPRYNLDVLYTSQNNLAERRTEIELTQTQLTTLRKDPEGQEVLFFFDIYAWFNESPGDVDVPIAHFGDFLAFIDQTPVDLKPLLDPRAAIVRWTYDRLGDE